MKQEPKPALTNEAHEELLSAEHEVFIHEMIAHGNRQKAYLEAYPSSGLNSAVSSAARLLKNRDIKKRIQQAKLQAYMQSIENLQAEYEGAYTDIMEKRSILAQIIRGEMPNLKDKNNGIKTSAIKDVLRAIALDTQLEEGWTKLL